MPGDADTPVLPVVVIGSISVVTFVAIAFEFLHKTVAALLGAIAAVIAGLLTGVFHGERPYQAVHEFIGHDLGVIGVIVVTSILVEIAAASRLFHFVTIKLVEADAASLLCCCLR
jgi:Na+/H+ antiporter NhaD/arsenite permease-like protein